MNLSLTPPKNEPDLDLIGSEPEWMAYQHALSQFPQDYEVPMVIAGKEIHSSNKISKISPITGKKIGTLQQGDEAHARLAIEAALDAKRLWSTLHPYQRIQKMRDLEQVMLSWRYEICATAATECGFTAKEVALSWCELIDFIRFNNYYYKELLDEKLGEGFKETNSLVLRPLKGFTCAVTPFNFPVAIGFHLPLAMALTGNTVVWKPSDEAPLTSFILMKAIKAAGFPEGVINMLTGDGKIVLPSVLSHKELTCMNFTGSFSTAKIFSQQLNGNGEERPHFPKLVAETGGKNFIYVDDEFHPKETAKWIAQGAFGRSGQKCSATSLLLLTQKSWFKLREILINETKEIVVGNPLQRQTTMGPVINKTAFERISGYIELAKSDKNCHVLVEGERDSQSGWYIKPTLIEVNLDSHPLLQNEIFGPLLCIKVVKDINHAAEIIKSHPFRLTGGIVSLNENFIQNAVNILSEFAGNLYINRRTTGAIVNQQPFGGDGASGTNCKAGGKWYLLNFISQCVVTRNHSRDLERLVNSDTAQN